ncbi:MAG: MGMT family protein [Aquimonas sp.]|jgi:methylated-DNA-protein-cysteine methyltransferase-like protein
MPDLSEPVDPVVETDRRAAILAVVRGIPSGEVRSYAQVARASGWPRHARLVARVLAHSEEPDLPWHRVLRADGRIAFPEGSQAWIEQCSRLRAEGLDLAGVRVRGMTRPRPPEPSLDEALWGQGSSRSSRVQSPARKR